jgi:ABC-type transport system substrate-binding protein
MKRSLILLLLNLFVSQGALADKPKAFLINYDRPLDSLNVFTQTGYVYFEFAFLAFDRLLQENPNTGELEPGLAESWQISKDKSSVVFRLRKNARFHDGKPITAEDIKFSWDVHNDPRYKSILGNSVSKSVKIEVIDPHTVRAILPYPSVSLFLSVGFWTHILPKHYYGDLTKEAEWRNNVVGSGPYKVTGFTTSKKIDLERNSDWWGFQIKSG